VNIHTPLIRFMSDGLREPQRKAATVIPSNAAPSGMLERYLEFNGEGGIAGDVCPIGA